jgi:TfoX/Sxy family transcriptional regulator of competence genes
MAYDEELADRIRALLPDVPVREQRMFGGLAFLIGGNMAVAASGHGGLLARVDPEQADDLIDTTAAEVMVMRGRPMTGWLHVPAEAVTTKRDLKKWVDRSTAYASTLPAKEELGLAGQDPQGCATD